YRHRRAMPERPFTASQPRGSHADAQVAPVRTRNAQPHGRTAKNGRFQDRRRLGPPDRVLCTGPKSYQGPAYQRRNIQYSKSAGWRPGSFHSSQSQARGINMEASTVAIVTGASRGLGQALVTSLLKSGTHVVSIARSENAEL